MSITLIRPFTLADSESVFQIAADTAFFGEPVEYFMEDRRLFCDAMYRYYTTLAWEYGWVAEAEGAIFGFLMGCVKTKEHPRNYALHILPGLVARMIAGRYHVGIRTRRYIYGLVRTQLKYGPLRVDLAAYPAHLHINVIAAARGQGLGRKLLQAYLDQLQRLAVPGVHLHTTDHNLAACKLYEKMGFRLLAARPTEAWAAFIDRPVEQRCYGLDLPGGGLIRL
jgi:ribosomal protein S18 acetylase RimI-like enzyme